MPRLPTLLPAAALTTLVLLLGGCRDDSEPAATLAAPTDPALAALYASTCQTCHANPASGAPLAGDTAAWAPRLAQGAERLLEHSINGYQGMPPMGLCMQCSEAQFLALIGYMSGQPLH
ncbi:c-type cytochrome [Pseudomonas xantholysinigenes]|uniref:C-type cytochrome n=1 Tax=Pseudomonas xantholysinigenes TaxID=2745490 RepID=A0A9E6PZ74_9PSED|nr:c-type cytochrome [Pseudomonas xantholysinigenes]QXI40275.1 c-type cytochrome [Pseudomonas xantholysinigenes]